jgi:hypothetical protein
MNARLLPILVAAFSAPILIDAAVASDLPTRIGQCVETRVREIANRLDNTPGSGSAISFVNGGYQVSYDQVPQVDRSRVGDLVTMCLVRIPKDCPPGDNRGREYRTLNKRTGQSWTLPDAEHGCGGA